MVVACYSLLNKESAFDFVTRLLHGKYGSWFTIIPTNVGRHRLLTPQISGVPKFYCLFKREYFFNFNYCFKKFVRENPEYDGISESINKEWLDYSIMVGVDYLLFVHPDHSVYVVHPLVVKRFCEKNNLIRTQIKTNDYKIPDFSESIERINELTYCFPIKLLTRMEV